MRRYSSKTLAILVISTTALGMLVSLFFLFQIWRIRNPVKFKLQSALDQTSAMLLTTSQGLDVIDKVIQNVYSSTIHLEGTTGALAQTVRSTTVFINSAGAFLGEDVINTITNTQRTLDTARSSAQVIDNIMSTLSRVPLIGIEYNPSMPLNKALGQVSDSLNPFQGSLKDFQINLQSTETNLQHFNDQLLNLEQNIEAINQNLASSQAVIDDYRAQITTYQTSIEKAKDNLPSVINTACWICTLIILWLVLVQIAILLQGIVQLSAASPIQPTTAEQ